MPGPRIALLRGINVGRAKRVAMGDLRDLFTGLGCANVTTLLNSGNVVFSGPAAVSETRIEKAFAERFGFSSRITVVGGAELIAAVEENPVPEIPDPSRFLVAFLKSPEAFNRLRTLEKQAWHPDILAVGARAAYLWCHEGVLDSPLNKAVAKALGDSVTARNWTTVLKLRALASQ
jgi:uncharacterized protein (DUF1697 family)